MITGQEYLDKIKEMSEKYFSQLIGWYEKEKDVSILTDSVIEGYLGLISQLYLTFSYEMEAIDKKYAIEFDRIKFAVDDETKPLSDKAVDMKIKITEMGQRKITLERRLKALQFAKEAISRSVQARIENNRQSKF